MTADGRGSTSASHLTHQFSGASRGSGEETDAIRAISVTPFTCYRWRKEFGGLKTDQVKRLKELEKENQRLRKAVSDLTLEKLILRGEASPNASGNY